MKKQTVILLLGVILATSANGQSLDSILTFKTFLCRDQRNAGTFLIHVNVYIRKGWSVVCADQYGNALKSEPLTIIPIPERQKAAGVVILKGQDEYGSRVKFHRMYVYRDSVQVALRYGVHDRSRFPMEVRMLVSSTLLNAKGTAYNYVNSYMSTLRTDVGFCR